ncbi:MAG: M1 family metallopeptidase [Bacteroidia bacterium]|nr:M1 family metallopeptidase [Bacteroidia bacterium]
MRKNLVLIVISLVSGHLVSQNLPKNLNQAKWQQRVAYQIAVTLNDKTHRLSGFETINYTNNSPNNLSEIYMHLWPNGYRNRNTAFAKQHLENGKSDFYFAPEPERGWIDSLNFMINGKPVKWQLTSDVDIAKLMPEQPIVPGETVEISTPFVVKIPGVFSRMGHDDGLYCITQWYPKPAVYDVNGWNPMPYLDQGEFYSEFGSFDVRITLPKNYVLAATGLVQDENEKKWWLQRTSDAGIEHPAIEPNKTVRFLQDSAHDFAWFCSKEFKVAHSEVILSNNKKIDTWLFAKSKFKDAKLTGVEYINEAVKFYSEKVGNYPYALAQVVITPLKAGGGMEYPTITNCQNIDETTIVHEVGHNWFYGILGSNERDYPWMDESFNTYYESRNKLEKSKKTKDSATTSATATKKGFVINFGDFDQEALLFGYASRKNLDQPGNLISTEYTDNNYGAIIYAKNPLGITYLQNYLGDKLFDEMMQDYYQKWQFKHPLPNDFEKHARQFTGKDLDWFFGGVLGSTKKEDYKFVKMKGEEMEVKNLATLNGPLAITRTDADGKNETRWVEGFTGTKKFNVNTLGFTPVITGKPTYMLDGEEITLDLYPQNNIYRKKGLFKSCAPIKFQLIGNVEKPHVNQIFWSPVYAYNLYNESMVGLAFYNSLFPQKKNEYLFVPMHSFKTKEANGYAQYWHNFYTTGKIRNIQVGIKGTRFASKGLIYESKNVSDQQLIDSSVSGNITSNITYEKFAPFILINLKPKVLRSGIEQSIQLRYVMVNEQESASGYFHNFSSQHIGTADISYLHKNSDVLYPRSFGINYQYGIQNSIINRLTAEIKQSVLYKDGKKTADIRLFAGAFLGSAQTNNLRAKDYFERSMFTTGGTLGVNDYFYDAAMIGRAESFSNNSFWAHQVLQRDAGFRNFVNLGNTDKWITAANLTIPLPIPVPIGVYGDISYANLVTVNAKSGKQTYAAQTSYVAGVYLQIIKDVAYWYIPLVSSKNVETAWNYNGSDNPFKRSSFVLNLNKLNPVAFIRNLKL